MFVRKHLLGILALAAIVAGLLVFGIGHEFSTNWARLVIGPLLWFIGFGMLVAWFGKVIAGTQTKQDEQEQAKRAANAASTRGQAR